MAAPPAAPAGNLGLNGVQFDVFRWLRLICMVAGRLEDVSGV